MKKQYVFIFLICITLYIIYLIFSHKYKEYQINSKIEFISDLNKEIHLKIEAAQSIIDYKTTSAYKNKILKLEQWMKNRGEKVVYITTEQKFKKFTTTNIEEESKKLELEYKNIEELWDARSMSNIDKWYYFIFQKYKEKSWMEKQETPRSIKNT